MSQEYRLGIVGGGQLGMMETVAAKRLGFEVTVVDPNITSECPAAKVGANHIRGGFNDAEAITKLAEVSDVVTIDLEHVNAGILQRLKESGTKVFPNPRTLASIQDKFEQKKMLRGASLPVVDHRLVEPGIDTPHSLYQIGEDFGYPYLLKTRFGGYDGRGNRLVTSQADIKKIDDDFLLVPDLYAEKYFEFEKELAVTIARSKEGIDRVLAYPVVETIHREGICDVVIAPAQIDRADLMAAEDLAHRYSKTYGAGGVDTIEMFLNKDGALMINEIAPRIHNSGHFSLDACETSHAENHVRGVMGLPLGPVKMLCRSAVMVNILSEDPNPVSFPEAVRKALAVSPEVNIHLYGKTPDFKRRRKVGHITVLEVDFEDTLYVARVARDAMQI